MLFMYEWIGCLELMLDFVCCYSDLKFALPLDHHLLPTQVQ